MSMWIVWRTETILFKYLDTNTALQEQTKHSKTVLQGLHTETTVDTELISQFEHTATEIKGITNSKTRTLQRKKKLPKWTQDFHLLK